MLGYYGMFSIFVHVRIFYKKEQLFFRKRNGYIL